MRPYQIEATEGVYRRLFDENAAGTLLAMATGTGKTFCGCEVVRRWPEDAGRVLWIAHRDELLTQAGDSLYKVCGEQVDYENADNRAMHAWEDPMLPPARVVVASVQSLNVQRRLDRYMAADFGLVVVDEAHHAVAGNKNYSKILKKFSHCKRLGLSATWKRHDNRTLKTWFPSVAYHYSTAAAVRDRFLVPIRQEYVTVSGLDLDPLTVTRAGEFNPGELDDIMRLEGVVHQICDPVFRMANHGGKKRRAIICGTSVAQAELMAEVLNRHDWGCAACVHGKTDKEVRRDVIAMFKSGQVQFLTSCAVFSEGFDEPMIQVVVPKMTCSASNYTQELGRGLRPWPGVIDGLKTREERASAIRASVKPSCLVLDVWGNSTRHKLVDSVDVLAGWEAKEVADAAKLILKANPGTGIDDAVKQARAEASEREAERKISVVLRAKFELRPVNPFDVFDIKEPANAYPWFRGHPASEKQLKVIYARVKELGPAADGINLVALNMAQAKVIIERLNAKRDEGPPTQRMSEILDRFGIDPSGMNWAEARKRIDEIAANGWRKIEQPEVAQDFGWG